MPTYDEAIANVNIVGLEQISTHPNLLVFADSGSGKTIFGGSDDKVLFISTENEGTLSAKRMGSTAVQWVIKSWKDVENALETLENWGETATGIPFNWVCFDSLTEGQDLLMDYINDEANVEVEGWPQYRLNQKKLMRTIKRFNALPVNMLWLALARKEFTPESDEFYCPDIHGKGYGIAMRVVAQMTSYGFLQVESKDVTVEKDGKKSVETRYRRTIYWTDVKSMKGKDRTLSLAPKTVLPPKDALKSIRLKIEAAFAADPKGDNKAQPAKVAPAKAVPAKATSK